MNGAAALTRKNGELVFDEAWQGRIFGMTVAMSHEACFAWREFQSHLIDEIAHAEREGESSSYYERWLHAFEQLLADKACSTPRRSRSARAISRAGAATTFSEARSA